MCMNYFIKNRGKEERGRKEKREKGRMEEKERERMCVCAHARTRVLNKIAKYQNIFLYL